MRSIQPTVISRLIAFLLLILLTFSTTSAVHWTRPAYYDTWLADGTAQAAVISDPLPPLDMNEEGEIVLSTWWNEDLPYYEEWWYSSEVYYDWEYYEPDPPAYRLLWKRTSGEAYADVTFSAMSLYAHVTVTDTLTDNPTATVSFNYPGYWRVEFTAQDGYLNDWHGGSAVYATKATCHADVTVKGMLLVQIKNGRTTTVGSFDQETNVDADMRLFVDTKETWNGGDMVAGHKDAQRAELTLQTYGLNPSSYYVWWEAYDPDDPASGAELDANDVGGVAKGGDNTGVVHEGGAHWFTQDSHTMTNQTDRAAVDETTVIGEAKTAISAIGSNSTAFFNFSDDGGDNFIIKYYVRANSDNSTLYSGQTGMLTVWRKRWVTAYSMSKTGGGVYYPSSDGTLGRLQTVLQTGFANTDAQKCAYIDVVARSGGAALPYAADLDIGAVGAGSLSEYVMANITHGASSSHSSFNFDLLAVKKIHSGATTLFGGAHQSPHVALGIDAILANQAGGNDDIGYNTIHELGHAFDLEVDKHHDDHTGGAANDASCAFETGTGHGLTICERHVKLLRIGVVRDFDNHDTTNYLIWRNAQKDSPAEVIDHGGPYSP